MSHGIGVLDDMRDREGDLDIVPGVEVVGKVIVADGVLVRSYDGVLGTVGGPTVNGVVGEALGVEIPRVEGVLLGQPLLPPPEYLP